MKMNKSKDPLKIPSEEELQKMREDAEKQIKRMIEEKKLVDRNK